MPRLLRVTGTIIISASAAGVGRREGVMGVSVGGGGGVVRETGEAVAVETKSEGWRDREEVDWV